MVSIIAQVWMVYIIPTAFFLIQDYWNPEQVSHYLGLDLIVGVIPALLYLLFCIYQIRKQQNPNEVKHD